jgi:hypothetical protein
MASEQLTLCQINVDQPDRRHALVFIWIEPVVIKFAACRALNLRSKPLKILQSAVQISDVRWIELRKRFVADQDSDGLDWGLTLDAHPTADRPRVAVR